MNDTTEAFRDADTDIECSCGQIVAVNASDSLPQTCAFCGAEVTEPKKFRVLVVARTYHYETVEAQNAEHAKEAVDNGDGERETELGETEYETLEAEEIA